MNRLTFQIERIKAILADDKNYQADSLKIGAIWDICDRTASYKRGKDISGRDFIEVLPPSQSLSQEAVRDEVLGYCWLIEHTDEGHLYYWTANPASSLVGPWTTDPFRAVRFHRKEDAESVAVGHAGAAWKVVCHHFDDAIKRELEPQIDAAEEEIRRLRTWISDDELAAYDALKREPNAAGQPRHLVRRGLKPDGTYPLADDDEPAPAAPDVAHDWIERADDHGVYDCANCTSWTANLPLYKDEVCDAKERRFTDRRKARSLR